MGLTRSCPKANRLPLLFTITFICRSRAIPANGSWASVSCAYAWDHCTKKIPMSFLVDDVDDCRWWCWWWLLLMSMLFMFEVYDIRDIDVKAGPFLRTVRERVSPARMLETTALRKYRCHFSLMTLMMIVVDDVVDDVDDDCYWCRCCFCLKCMTSVIEMMALNWCPEALKHLRRVANDLNFLWDFCLTISKQHENWKLNTREQTTS